MELFRYIFKIIVNLYFKFERNLSWILLPQEFLKISWIGPSMKTTKIGTPRILSQPYYRERCHDVALCVHKMPLKSDFLLKRKACIQDKESK